jgi:CheY-like chemotaxis protein/signal transduction histidine kinase
MKALKYLSVRTKLLLISLVPLLVIAYLLFEKIRAEMSERENSLRLVEEFREIESISNLVHELQIERGLSFGYLIANRKEYEIQLSDQHNKTDIAVAQLKEVFEKHDKRPDFIAVIDSIPYSRGHQIPHLEFLNRAKLALIREITQNVRISKASRIQNDLWAHVRLIQSKEFLARIRSIVEPALLAKKFDQDTYQQFASFVGRYEYSSESFKDRAHPSIVDFYQRRFTGTDVEATFEIIDSLLAARQHISTLDGGEWWNRSTSSINKLKTVEDFSLGQINDVVKSEVALSLQTVTYSMIAGVILATVIGLLVFSIIHQLTSSISEIKTAAEKITLGHVGFTVNESGHDELTSLARSFNQMIHVTRQYVSLAQTIGKGDYTAEVAIRSDEDTLGAALAAMKQNLRQLSIENENRTWLLTGNSKVNDAIHGDKDLVTLTNDILLCTVQYLEAQMGTFYVRQNDELQLKSSYAFRVPEERMKINTSDGLIGQAVKNREPIFLDDVPDGYIKLTSSLGESTARHLVLYPFVYEEEVKGVIELAFAKPITQLQVRLLQTTAKNIGIAVEAAQARERLTMLLEETQRQSEELMSQGEELTIANEELQQKTEMLERSEEELRAQQEELQQTNDELQKKANMLELQKQQVEDSKKELESKARELEQINRYKSEFLANMSHELRTPLNSILILSQVLLENRNDKLGAKEIQFANTIHNAGTDLMALINEVLDLSKIEAGKMDLEIQPFQVSELAKSIKLTFEEVASRKAIDFGIEIQDSFAEKIITSDFQRVEQVLNNLLSNAFKFTDEGGKVTLRIEKPAKGIVLKNDSLLQAGEVIAFSVEDTGIGIPPDKLGPIFEAFQQGDGSTKRKYGGTGLGLSISRELSLLLGGEIHLESKVNEGSTFRFFLPVTYNGMAEDSSPDFRIAVPIESGEDDVEKPKTIRAGEHERTILVIEHDQEIASLLLKQVQKKNYQGILADYGTMGINYARTYRPDAIIMNLELPGMSGIEVLDRLKKDPELRHIPVQVISSGGHKEKIMEMGAFDVVEKPMLKKDLFERLERLENFVSRKIKKLLIVEDNRQHNNAIQELIGNGDVKCYPAYTGEEAEQLLDKEEFDCIIIDIGLPGMSGFRLLDQIKEREDTRKIPVIVYTGRTLTREENSRLEKLANAIVVKTAFSHERLLDETTLFLHRVESRLPREKQQMIRKLHKSDQILRGKKVLVVDDDVRKVYSLVAAFEQDGLICVIAENGKGALKALEEHPDICMVLMDVMMPEMDGYEATKEIRKRNEFKHLPVIALTAKAMKGDREKCLAAGMSDYVSKPVKIQQLLSLMRVWLYA